MFLSTKIERKNNNLLIIFKKNVGASPFCYIFASMFIMVKRLNYLNGLLLLLLLQMAGMAVGRANEVVPVFQSKPSVADSILNHMFQSASVYSTQVKSYEAELYLKGVMRIHKRNSIIKYVPSMFRFEKGVNNYLHESISNLHYTAPNIYDRKIRAVSTTFPGGNSRFFDVLDYLKFNIYSPSVMDDKILSPLNPASSKHYRYVLDSVSYNKGEPYYKIQVIPRFSSTQLIEGYFWISTADWHISYMMFQGKYDVVTFRLDVQMGDTQQTKYLPHLMHLNVFFSFMNNKMEMNYTGWMKYGAVSFRTDDEMMLRNVVKKKRYKQYKYNLSNSYTLTCDTTQMLQNLDAFNRIRPIPLSAWEDSLYVAFDKRRQERADTLQAENETKKNKTSVFWGQVGDVLVRSYNIDMSKVGNVKCSPLINPLLIGYSHRKGISYRQVFKYNKIFHDGRTLRLAPQVGYNFTKKELYAKIDAQYVYNPRRHGSFEVYAGNGNRIYSSVVLDQLNAMPDSSFSFDGLELDYFKDVYLNVSHNIEIVNGLNLWTGISMHWRYTKSTPEVEARVRSRYNSFAPRVRLTWTPGLYYYMNGNRKIDVGSRFPTFVLDYERGIPVMEHSGTYARLEVSAEQKIRVRNIHTIAYHVGAGCFSNSKDMYFVDYVDFADRNLPQGWSDDIGGTFQMLDGRWYNASRHYVRGNVTYETPFLLLYPVTRLLSFVQKERVYAGVLFMPHLNPYLEIGYGLGTHLFDFGVFVGNEQGKFTSVGCKFTFELFNK